MKIPQDIIGEIAILKFPEKTFWITKKLKARKFLKNHPSVKTVLEKTEKFSGELRLQKTKHLAGEKTKQTIYKENNCLFKMNVDKTYFSPRLSNERKIISEEITKKVTKKKNKILVMFAGIAPFPITIAKTLKQNKKQAEIISNELNKMASEQAEENINLNKVRDYIKVIQGDSNKLPEIIKKINSNKNNKDSTNNQFQKKHTKNTNEQFASAVANKERNGATYTLSPEAINSKLQSINLQIPDKFDFIIMPRPNLDDTFLKSAQKLSKKGTEIYYYGFGEKQKVLNEIKKDLTKKYSKIEIRKAGDIGPYKYRWLAHFKIL